MRIGQQFLAGTLGVALIVLALVVAQAIFAGSAAAGGSAVASIVNAAGDSVGTAKLIQKRDGVEIRVQVAGLSVGFHGFHVHAVGTCDPAASFTTAAGHFNPAGQTHGQHAGDLPILFVGSDGVGQARIVTDRFHVADLFDADGSALIIHAAPDNYANVPTRYASATGPGPDVATLATGDAGGRVACGVIVPAGDDD
jgi:Cu-Zn family superoxide dismutase